IQPGNAFSHDEIIAGSNLDSTGALRWHSRARRRAGGGQVSPQRLASPLRHTTRRPGRAVRTDPKRHRGGSRQRRPHRNRAQDCRSEEPPHARSRARRRVASIGPRTEDRSGRRWPRRLRPLPTQRMRCRGGHGRQLDQAATQRPDSDIHHLPDARGRHRLPDEPQGLRRGLRQAALTPGSQVSVQVWIERPGDLASSGEGDYLRLDLKIRIRSMTSPTMSLLDRAGLDRQDARRHIAHGLEGADDGELYLEYAQSEMLAFDNGRLKQATYNTDQGFRLRAVKDEAVGYAHSSDLSEAALARAADAVRAVKGGYSGHYAEPPARTNVRLYGDENPLGEPAFESK